MKTNQSSTLHHLILARLPRFAAPRSVGFAIAVVAASLAAAPLTALGQTFLYTAGEIGSGNATIQRFNLAVTGSNNLGITSTGSTGNFYRRTTGTFGGRGLVYNTSGDVFFTNYGGGSGNPELRSIYKVSSTGSLTQTTTYSSPSVPATATLTGIAINQANNWLYLSDFNGMGGSTGRLYRVDASSMSILNSATVSGNVAMSPASNPRSGLVMAAGGARNAPVFVNYTADLSKQATVTLSGTSLVNSNFLFAGGIEWAGRDAIYVGDFSGKKVYRFNLGGVNADGLFTTATLDTSFGTGGAVTLPNPAGQIGVGGLSTDGQSLYIGSYQGNALIGKYSLNGQLVQANYLDTQTRNSPNFVVSSYIYNGNGTGVWSGAAGGSWGTIHSSANWTALGGVPGINQLYTYDDTATFGSALAASGTVTLDGAQPKLGQLTFNNAASRYTIASGTGSGVLSLVAGSAAGSGTASITVTAGIHAISAPVALTSAGDFIVSNAADTLSISGAISGGAGKGLTKRGLGRLALAAANSFTGATRIAAGVLEVDATGAINTSSGITLDGATAELKYNSATTLTAPITFTQGTISGTGAIGTAVAAGSGDILSPGNSPGAQAYTSGLAWNPGGTYVWELNALTGVAGTNWDILNVTGGLNLSALAVGSTFNLDLVTLTGGNTAGPLGTAYVPGSSHTFALATFDTLSVPTGFSTVANSNLTSLFTIGLSGWQGTQPAVGDISVRVNSAGTGIDLVIVPEPGSLALAGIGIAAAAYALRSRSLSRKRAG